MKKLVRIEQVIDHFDGTCLVEIRPRGISVSPRNRPGIRHNWNWDYLLRMCACTACEKRRGNMIEEQET